MLNRRFGLCVALVAVCSFAHGDSFIGGSSILHPGDVTTLSGWLGGGSLQLTKIFDMESGDGQTPYDFHLAADRNGPTISAFDVNVVTADEDEGPVIGDHFVIGGYDPQSWDSDNDWHTTSVLAGRTAFIFNLTTGTKQAQILTDGSDGPGAYQTSNTAYYYPIFGEGDIFGGDGDINSVPGFATQYSYGDSEGHVNILGGTDTYFRVNQMEVYTFDQAGGSGGTPELPPSALTLLGLIPVAVGRLRRRRMV